MFTTMGGQSRCPGETGTIRRESQVSIVDVIPRCGSNSSECTNKLLEFGEKAHFGIIIQNNSPTGRSISIYLAVTSYSIIILFTLPRR